MDPITTIPWLSREAENGRGSIRGGEDRIRRHTGIPPITSLCLCVCACMIEREREREGERERRADFFGFCVELCIVDRMDTFGGAQDHCSQRGMFGSNHRQAGIPTTFWICERSDGSSVSD